MAEAARDFDVRLNGRPLRIRITLNHPGGPIPSAFALAGANLFLWMAMEPERVHRLMDIVTESHMRCIRYFDEMSGRNPEHPALLGCDAGEQIGPDKFRQFAVPYYLRIWEVYKGPRAFHNCGKSEHLLDIIRDELAITSLDGFGFCVDPDVLAEKMSGRVILSGGPDPSLIKSGPYERIVEESRRYIETLGRRGGYILACGGGAAAGTPVEHFGAMVEASKQLGCVMRK
jgi:uroporphyrinogen decarboxylase